MAEDNFIMMKHHYNRKVTIAIKFLYRCKINLYREKLQAINNQQTLIGRGILLAKAAEIQI